jgi:hypothetical protein
MGKTAPQRCSRHRHPCLGNIIPECHQPVPARIEVKERAVVTAAVDRILNFENLPYAKPTAKINQKGGYMTRRPLTLHTALWLFTIPIFFIPSLLQADVYLKYRQHTDPVQVMGQTQPAKDSIRETWVGENRIRNDEGRQSVILRLDKKQVYFINNEQKMYAILPMDVEKMAQQAIENDKTMSLEEKEQARKFVQEMMKDISKFTIAIKETGEKKKIGKWNCSKYIQTTKTAMGPSVTEIWATKDITLDYKMLNRMFAASMMMMPSLKGSMDDISREMAKIKGVTVYSASSSSVMDTEVRSTQELLDCADRNPPDSFYEPPKEYTMKKM